jgi:hypothetical protein
VAVNAHVQASVGALIIGKQSCAVTTRTLQPLP